MVSCIIIETVKKKNNYTAMYCQNSSTSIFISKNVKMCFLRWIYHILQYFSRHNFNYLLSTRRCHAHCELLWYLSLHRDSSTAIQSPTSLLLVLPNSILFHDLWKYYLYTYIPISNISNTKTIMIYTIISITTSILIALLNWKKKKGKETPKFTERGSKGSYEVS